jgi:epoxyqueuosine reductase
VATASHTRINNGFTERLEAEARALGFVAFGVAAADAAPEAAGRLRAWLDSGAHGDMLWMEERSEQRGSPAALWPEVRSVIMLGMSYAPAEDPLRLAGESRIGRISVYAQGQDYHDIVKKALKALARWIVKEADANVKVFVDTAPVMEKPLAAAAGLGWQGKHSNLVSTEHGSWLLLGAIMTTLEIGTEVAADAPHPLRCGSCDACLRACPTDARRCISYLTIENKGPIPAEFRAGIGNRVYGCDDCLGVCPWNKFAATASANRAFFARAELAAPEVADLIALDDAGFRAVFAGSPIKRIGRDRMVRNALIAAGNGGDVALAPQVTALLDDPAAIVRGAAVWALARIDAARWRLEQAKRWAAEPDEAVRAEWLAVPR